MGKPRMVRKLALDTVIRDKRRIDGWTDSETMTDLEYFGTLVHVYSRNGHFSLFVDGRFDFSAVLDYLRETYQVEIPESPTVVEPLLKEENNCE